MQNFVVKLQSEVSTSFRCQKAANSLDIDTAKKSIHELQVAADLVTPYNIGLIVGASGSGKTTLAKQIFGQDCFKSSLDLTKPVIDQFPPEMSYEDCCNALIGIGLTSVPCWIRPAYTLSNGQRARAEAALQIALGNFIVDEWTSVVDRTVAKVMSHCVQKHARRAQKQCVLLSCHYDVIEWLNPDWIIDCNKQEFIDRRAMVSTFQRSDQLRLDIREVSRKTWPYFSKYHYLNERLPGGTIYNFGLFHGVDQIGFVCYAAYIIGNFKTYFFNRLVIHPDYAGLGLGILFLNVTAREMSSRGFDIKGKFSSVPVYRSLRKDLNWRCKKIDQPLKAGRVGSTSKTGKNRSASLRSKTTTYHFDYVGCSSSST